MSTGVACIAEGESSKNANGELLVALPEPGLSMTQDAEWCVVHIDGKWRHIRFHDYDELYSVPGLYEKVIYDILRCDSPRVLRDLLETELSTSATPADELRALDLGAGNGLVGEELADLGADFIVGVDIIEDAAEATKRDRPGIYDNYHVVDLANLNEGQQREMAGYRFNTLTCVAALGFGDIPAQTFIAAYNLIRSGGWIVFNIKEDFLTNGDDTGFAGFIRAILDDGTLELRQRRRYQHRLATDHKPIHYVAFVGRKRRDIS
ncbi:MAG: methyltransferase domain-containing protein [Phycisphaerales bacterium]|nr:methyltransferase domain-containing protein [Phycisphaerales bacterium]